MMAADPLAVYRKNQVTTVSPEKIVLLLYDGAIKYLVRGKGAIERGDIQSTNDNLCQAQEIVATLMGALDREAGGNLADNLDALYNYVLRLVGRANVNKDARLVQEAMDLLGEIRSGWREAVAPGPAGAVG